MKKIIFIVVLLSWTVLLFAQNKKVTVSIGKKPINKDIVLPERYSDGVSVGKEDDNIQFIPIGAKNTKGIYIEQARMTVYYDIFTDTDIKTEIHSFGKKEIIVLKSNKAPKVFRWLINIQGSWTYKEGVITLDNSGITVPYPTAYYIDEETRRDIDVPVTVNLLDEGTVLEYIVPEVPRYPMYLDPTVIVDVDVGDGVLTAKLLGSASATAQPGLMGMEKYNAHTGQYDFNGVITVPLTNFSKDTITSVGNASFFWRRKAGTNSEDRGVGLWWLHGDDMRLSAQITNMGWNYMDIGNSTVWPGTGGKANLAGKMITAADTIAWIVTQQIVDGDDDTWYEMIFSGADLDTLYAHIGDSVMFTLDTIDKSGGASWNGFNVGGSSDAGREPYLVMNITTSVDATFKPSGRYKVWEGSPVRKVLEGSPTRSVK